MSFILDSIKQAERERRLGQVPTITVEYASQQNVLEEKASWVKWFTLLIGALFAVMAAWVAIRMTSDNFLAATSEVIKQKIAQAENHQANNEENSVAVNTAPDKQAAIVQKKSEPKKATEPKATEEGVSENEMRFSSTQNLRNSELKAVQLINDHEQVSQSKIVDKRTKFKQIKEEQAAFVSKKEDLAPKNNTEANVAKLTPPQIEDTPKRKQLYSLYSDLSALEEKQVLPQDSPDNIRFIDEEIIHNENPELLASVEPPRVNNDTPIQEAVNTGLLEFGELPYEVQENIPDLNISVHMFNEEASDRRIRINGRMYTEGASLQRDLSLVEITRYGAVFDYQGHQFRLNVR